MLHLASGIIYEHRVNTSWLFLPIDWKAEQNPKFFWLRQHLLLFSTFLHFFVVM